MSGNMEYKDLYVHKKKNDILERHHAHEPASQSEIPAASLATKLHDMMYELLQSDTLPVMVKIVVRQAATIVAESRIGFYFW